MPHPSSNPSKVTSSKIDLSQAGPQAPQLKVGRREPPKPEDPRKRRWVMIRSLLLAALVVVAFIVIIFVVGAQNANPFGS